jgi:hypothetical protein
MLLKLGLQFFLWAMYILYANVYITGQLISPFIVVIAQNHVYVDIRAKQMNGFWDTKLRHSSCARLFRSGAVGWLFGGRNVVQHPRRLSDIRVPMLNVCWYHLSYCLPFNSLLTSHVSPFSLLTAPFFTPNLPSTASVILSAVQEQINFHGIPADTHLYSRI